MRTLVLCLVGATALVTLDYVATSNGASLGTAAQSVTAPTVIVDRTRKGDRSVSTREKTAVQRPDMPTPQPVKLEQKLPDGCEPSVSPLAGAAAKAPGMPARCVAGLVGHVSFG